MLVSYGGGASSSGGGISYGPVFWIIVAIVAVAIIGLAAWMIGRKGRAASPSTEHRAARNPRHSDRAA